MLTDHGPWAPGELWHYGFLFAPALTIGGGTGEVQRNIVAERSSASPTIPRPDMPASAPARVRARPRSADTRVLG